MSKKKNTVSGVFAPAPRLTLFAATLIVMVLSGLWAILIGFMKMVF